MCWRTVRPVRSGLRNSIQRVRMSRHRVITKAVLSRLGMLWGCDFINSFTTGSLDVRCLLAPYSLLSPPLPPLTSGSVIVPVDDTRYFYLDLVPPGLGDADKLTDCEKFPSGYSSGNVVRHRKPTFSCLSVSHHPTPPHSLSTPTPIH